MSLGAPLGCKLPRYSQDARKELIEIIEAKIKDKYTMASFRQDPSKVGIEIAERL